MLRSAFMRAFVGVSVFAIAGSAMAAPVAVPILNQSFESESLSAGGFGSGAVPSWTGGQDLRPTSGTTSTQMLAATPDGLNVVNLFPGSAIQSSASQVLTTNLAASTTYTLTVFAGARNLGGSSIQFGGYNVSLLTGATPLASITSADVGAIIPSAGNYALLTLTYTSPSVVAPGQALTVSLAATAPINTTIYRTLFDNVQLTSDAAATPEPTCLAGFGLIGGALLRRRRS